MSSLFTQLSAGIMTPFRGIEVALRPANRRWVVIPCIVGILVFVAGLSFGFVQALTSIPALARTVAHFVSHEREGLYTTAVYWLLLITFWPFFTAAILYVLFLITKILVSPFYSLLAERVLIDGGVIADNPFHLAHWVRTSVRMLAVSLVRAALFAAAGVFLFAISWIPGLGIFAAFGLLLLMTFDLTDYSFEAMQMGLRARLRFFFMHFPAFFGFAVALGLVFLVPGLNFVLFPAAVAGASDLVRRLTKRMSDSSAL